MRRLVLVFASALLVSGCASSKEIVRQRTRTVITLMLPEAVTADEARSDRVTLLFENGRVSTFESATVTRVGENLEILTYGVRTPLVYPIAQVRAVEIERRKKTSW